MYDDQNETCIVNLRKFDDEDADLSAETILDTRFQCHQRVYIADLLNAESAFTCTTDAERAAFTMGKREMVKMNGCFLYKVAVCGFIVSIYEAAKSFHLKVDDTTGCINVTLWKSTVFDDDSVSTSGIAGVDTASHDYADLYMMLNAITARIKEPSLNHSVMYAPKQGDLVSIRAHTKYYRDHVELKAISCVRVQVQVLIYFRLFKNI